MIFKILLIVILLFVNFNDMLAQRKIEKLLKGDWYFGNGFKKDTIQLIKISFTKDRKWKIRPYYPKMYGAKGDSFCVKSNIITLFKKFDNNEYLPMESRMEVTVVNSKVILTKEFVYGQDGIRLYKDDPESYWSSNLDSLALYNQKRK